MVEGLAQDVIERMLVRLKQLADAMRRMAADAGDEEARAMVEPMSWLQDGVVTDHAAALEWFRTSSQRGDPAAQAWLDWMMKRTT